MRAKLAGPLVKLLAAPVSKTATNVELDSGALSKAGHRVYVYVTRDAEMTQPGPRLLGAAVRRLRG